MAKTQDKRQEQQDAPGVEYHMVQVYDKYDDKYGALVRDAEARWLPVAQAARLDQSVRRAAQIPAPELSGKTPPTQQDVERMERYTRQMASVPQLFAVQRIQGRSFRQTGIYVVKGPRASTDILFSRNTFGQWQEREGFEWLNDTPFADVAEARAAFPQLPPPPVAPVAPRPDTPEVAELRRQNAALRNVLETYHKMGREQQVQAVRDCHIESAMARGKSHKQAEAESLEIGEEQLA